MNGQPARLPQKELYNRARAAKFLHIQVDELDKLVASREFPKPDRYIFGDQPRWLVSTLRKWREERHSKPTELALEIEHG